MGLRAATKEEREFARYALQTRENALNQITNILYAERDYLRTFHDVRSKITSIPNVYERKRAYMRAVEDRLDEEAIAKFGVPAFVVIG